GPRGGGGGGRGPGGGARAGPPPRGGRVGGPAATTPAPRPEPSHWRARTEVTGEVGDERVDLGGPFEHEHVTRALEHLEVGAGDELGDAPGLRRRRHHVGAAAEDERR